MEVPMNSVRSLVLAGMLGFASATAAFAAGDPLFVSVTSSPQAHRTEMALMFAQNVVKKDHPVTIFLNDEAVKVATRASVDTANGKLLAEAIKAGITVIVCPNCLKYYKLAEADLVGGVKIGNPDLTQGALFAPNTRTLSW
jgi:predicted peroxiredoxin